MPLLSKYWPLALTAIVVAGILVITLRPYGGNVSALFHLDTEMAMTHPVPLGFVVLDMPGYDGMQYYQIARTVPQVATPSQWPNLASTIPLSYAYQRILLPISAYILALGNIAMLPWAFLLINSAALIGTAVIMLRWNPSAKLEALALSLSPAALIGLHFNLAEPVTLVLLTWFLIRYIARQAGMPAPGLKIFDVLLLSLLVLAREVNILFVGLLLVWMLLSKRWKNGGLLLIPIVVFLLWHGLIYKIFENIPFLTSADKRAFPFGAIIDVFRGVQGYNRLTFSSMALFLGFVLPAIVWLLSRVIQKRRIDFLELGSLAFLGLMSMMAWHIWGSITSIGRVITPVYPLFLLYAAGERSVIGRLIAGAILILGLAIGFALALTVHPYHLA